jgi:predicted amino acid dehydrogenase
MDPLSIKNLLAHYTSRIRAPQGIVCKEVVKAYTELGIPCTESDVAYTPATKTVTITAVGPKKIEMLMRKKEALTRVRATLSERDAPADII